MNEEKIVNERFRKSIDFLKKNYQILSYLILALIVYLAVKIRSSNIPGLKNVVDQSWTLGPDLDPYLFLRWSEQIVQNGSLSAFDAMRYVPLGFHTNRELLLHPYMMAWFHKFVSLFVSESVTYSAIIYPVFFFALTIIAFFFLVRLMFSSSLGDKRANIIALIASFFLSVIPSLIPRTIAGIPEKESAAFFFLFITFYFFLSAWKSKNLRNKLIFGALSGLSTGAMALVWGGYVYVFVTLGASVLLSFILNGIEKKNFYTYLSWIFVSFLIMNPFSGRYTLGSLLGSVTTLSAFTTLFILAIHLILFETSLKSKFSKYLNDKIPDRVYSIAVAVVIGIVLASVVFGPSFLLNKSMDAYRTLISPISDRLGLTVAENKQPYFNEWAGSFGPSLQGLATTFWLLILGSILLFYNLFTSSSNKEKFKITLGFTLFLVGVIFSRYSSNSVLNGTNSISLFVYLAGFLIFGYFLGESGIKSFTKSKIYKYAFYSSIISLLLFSLLSSNLLGKLFGFISIISIIIFLPLVLIGMSRNESYKSNDFSLILLFIFFFLSLVSARGAVRLILMLVPSASILVGYLAVSSVSKSLTVKDSKKVYFWIISSIIVFATLFAGYGFYSIASETSKSYVPSVYNQQWQKAMFWVSNNTPEDSVFGHWWDYGYWVQSIGKRATVLDGGNAIPYWNYLMGRYALTGTSNKESAEFLYAHNTTHFLIDSTDIGKYSAYSTIGSDKNYDRASFLPAFFKNSQQVQETKDSTLILYQGGTGLDQDILYEFNGTKIFLPSGKAGLAGFILERGASENIVSQPQAIFIYQNQQYNIPLRYVFEGDSLIDFGEGLDAGVFVFPRLSVENSQASISQDGALLYLSSRVIHSQLARLYLFKENNTYFDLVHSEDDFLVSSLKIQGQTNADFVYYDQLRGPIRIWEINYPEDIEFKQEYLQTDYPEEIARA